MVPQFMISYDKLWYLTYHNLSMFLFLQQVKKVKKVQKVQKVRIWKPPQTDHNLS